MELCRAEDYADGTVFYCTQSAGHAPANEHQTNYFAPDPSNPEWVIPAVHTWTTPA